MPTLTDHKRVFTTIRVKVMDMSSVLDDALNWLRQNKPELASKVNSLSPGWEMGYVITKNNELYVIDRDGTGYSNPINNQNPVKINLYGVSWEFLHTTLVTAKLTYSDILALPVKGEENLANFIRTYGSRLEANYQEWKDFLEPMTSLKVYA